MSTLYVVATPIGNLGDMSPRALDTLRAVDLIAAEDTRRTLQLLNHFDIRKPLTSLHEHNEQGKGAQLAARMAAEGISVALVTDAGTPAVSDPGALFVRQAAEAGIEVVAVPGPSAAIAALSVSGILNPSFSFFAFPPRAKKELVPFLQGLKGHHETVILNESPHRVQKLLEAVLEALGDVPASISCDLSKLHERTDRGPVSWLIRTLAANEKAALGEYVVLLDLSGLQATEPISERPLSLEALLVECMLQGESLRDAMAALQQGGHKKNAVYAASLRVKGLLADGSRE